LGMSVACVEKEKLGGVCLNIGCIPTKAMLTSALLANEMKDAEDHGIQADGMSFDLGPAQQRSRRVAHQMNQGVHHLFKKYGPTHVEGHGRIAGKGTVEVEDGNGGTETLRSDHIIVATGSRPRNLPILEIDEEKIWSSTGALFQEKAPETLAVVGAGAVGMEFADIYEAYGSRVTILEALERVLPIEDADASKAMARAFERRGMEIHTSARLESSEVGGDSVKLVFTDADGEEQTLEVERVLSAVGRVPNTEDVGLDTVGVERTEEGNFVAVDEWLRTNVEGVYAIGDCAGNQLLAHKASHEGIVCVENIAGEAHHPVDYGNVPNCTYCHPEVASVGLTEAQAKDEGYDVEVGKFPFVGNGRAVAAGDADGFVKVVRDRTYSEVLGAHIVGPHATELIAEFVLGRHLESTVEEMEKAMHPHPTLSEAIAEGALASLGRPIHI
nr:dihydrolipoyl dehydrogenase [Gemmatimonadota bacterium]NIR78713.1 dihydrolipoyl dehydrogenase [Gemmatimonadota bacterium]NIT87352.1 dihydrolipoyl dehydrogenase [Gemmatimonadota bacterium]NIU31196.1 dihydrolipoyl dehydrogenase [Gemmatimonadota bacterium]NIU35926.1 dihydrolipoyl dehydrogenase [Gemmatimonadota bacterium]